MRGGSDGSPGGSRRGAARIDRRSRTTAAGHETGDPAACLDPRPIEGVTAPGRGTDRAAERTGGHSRVPSGLREPLAIHLRVPAAVWRAAADRRGVPPGDGPARVL